MERLKEKVAIVTGAGTGMGKATAKLFAEEGAKVAVTDVNEETAKQTCEEIVAAGGEAAYYKLDVSCEKDCKDVIGAVVAKWGKLDVLVNNAGVTGVDKPTHELTEKEWDFVFNVDVKGVFFMTKHAVPYMKENGKGSIINFSSIYGIVGSRELPAYHAAKGAVSLMTKKDAITYAADHIRVNSVHPGTILTPLVQSLADQDPEYLAKQLALHPLGYLGQPIDVAYGVLFLASDEARFVTGSQLVIDGGYTAK